MVDGLSGYGPDGGRGDERMHESPAAPGTRSDASVTITLGHDGASDEDASDAAASNEGASDEGASDDA